MGAPKVTTKPGVPKPPPKKPPIKVGGKEAKTIRTPKNFTVVDWDRAGQKIMVHAASGMGKTTLAMLLKNPVFIGTDDGGGIMRHPVTGERIKVVDGVEDFYDVLDAFDSNVFDPYDDIVIDTITEVQRWMVPWMLENITKQGGGKAAHLEDYGFHKGYRHWFETMEKLLTKFDRWVRKGKNIVLLAQSTGIRITNEGGEDYKVAGPDLYHDDKFSIMNLVKSWCDHVFRIHYADVAVKNKKATSNQIRAIYIHPRIEFIAKSRTISEDWPCVTFENTQDDSIWRLLFNGDQG